MSYKWRSARDKNGDEVLIGFTCDRDGCNAQIMSDTWKLAHEYGWSRRQRLIGPLSFAINEHFCAAHADEGKR